IISVEGKALNIIATLDSAFRHIRDMTRVIYVWADGVCVNQKGVEDRNTQVGLMAHHTIIFLGDLTPEIDDAVKIVSQPAGCESSACWIRGQFGQFIYEQVMSRLWFSRVWVLQGLVLSSDPWI
ncbi:hypothetical protein BKA65DRAFT_412085, partial [Rhexocercosporidium sp. MPI-PUGE-AT-0058]